MDTSIYFAPLQSFTTLPYYLAYHKFIGGIDKYFTPFYRVEKNGCFEIEDQLFYRLDIPIVPQVLTNEGEELVDFAKLIYERGFDEINLNLGCPFPMVVNRQLGSGLLPYPERIRRMLSIYFEAGLPLKLSVKLRLGLLERSEFIAVLEVLKEFPLEEVIMHSRLGKQKYKGTPDWDAFEEINKDYSLVGNGDITSFAVLDDLKLRFPEVSAWMIGRGLLINPCMLIPELDWKDTIQKLHEEFLTQLQEFGFSDHQILNQLKCFWEYPSQFLDGGQRIYRKMRRVGDYQKYLDFKSNLLRLETIG
ncbi:tRNA-dihydrouridine synthase family protein [Labilibacter marinus]|uniref:tRNA-dihydrouridine synthase family protein n=1 Tax=Labilibacter marinus TaxID=1477105 RepID=UPI00082C2242|nr:tRNA-dihydrouridine synthase family protein [Labilibacter marinus]